MFTENRLKRVFRTKKLTAVREGSREGGMEVWVHHENACGSSGGCIPSLNSEHVPRA